MLTRIHFTACVLVLFAIIAPVAVFADNPVILTQPQSQFGAVGSNITFTVVPASAGALPSVSSGTLRLWLRADVGVVTNASGKVTQWQDQSGNANHAAPKNVNGQPLLVQPAGIYGRSAVRFDGIQDNVNGDYLYGSGDVGIPNAYTSFMVYNALETTNNENSLYSVGVPGGTYGACRADDIVSQKMYYSGWAYDYITPFVIPTNTYRIWTTRLNTNLTQVELFDRTTAPVTNFNITISGYSAPGPGYYVGGYDPSVGYTATGRNFGGDIAEVIFYRGQLTDTDRLAVEQYLRQKYFQPAGSNFVFQWNFNGSAIAGETNASLTLTNVQLANAGTYTVLVSQGTNSTLSSNAMLTVGFPPSISQQPVSQTIVQDSNAVFSVSASGSDPLNYQWLQNGIAVAGATSSTLSLGNAQAANAGSYTVVITNSFGSATSSTAVLQVTLKPRILVQPQSQNVLVGSNVTLTVLVANAAGGGSLPAISSGTLQLWLKADAGLVTNSSGQVNQWQDQSGNTNHANAIGVGPQPTMVSPVELSGRPAVHFERNPDGVNGGCLHGTGDVGIPDAYTSFMVYNAQQVPVQDIIAALVGYPGTYGGSRAYALQFQKMTFATWTYDYQTSFVIPTNTYRIWTDRFNTNMNQLDLFDTTGTSTTNFSLVTSGQVAPSPGYYVGGVDPSIIYVNNGRNFAGNIAEMIYYRGQLSEPDRLAVEQYLLQKYFQQNTTAYTYQWFFNGSPVADATNSSFTISNAQSTNAGTYNVVVSDGMVSNTSSNAVLNVGFAPAITLQPVSQTVVQSNSVSFSVVATGSDPLSYQWSFNGAAIAGATASALSLSSAQLSNSGNYTVVITNSFGSVTSSTAVLEVDALPQITSQPPNTIYAAVGSTAIIAASAANGSGATLPAVPSGTLRLWLKADAGLVTNASGQVSVWHDQSGNANDATQANSGQQPLLVNPVATNNWAAVRFDGVESSTSGDFMQGSGDVGIPNAFTAFLFYSENSTSDSYGWGKDVWMAGVPSTSGSCRGFASVYNEPTFTTWNIDYFANFSLPVSSYRISTLRFNTNQDFAELFDYTASSSNLFTFNTSGQSTPGAGYYIGGMGSQIRNFGGDIAELIIYRGALSDNDRLQVEQYLQQKYYQTPVTAGLLYQWQFNGAALAGATNATLVITNVQFANAGTYDLIVSNSAGTATSSNATLVVGIVPSINSQPQSQRLPVNSTLALSVSASGTDPLSYQWRYNGTPIVAATTSTLTLTNVQAAAAGSYSVVITNVFGTVISSNAGVTVDPYPQIFGQPQSQTVTLGNGVSFSFSTDPVLPAVASGTLRLWLKADAGVTTNSNGQVSQWRDQSANANHAGQSSSSQQPLLVRPAAIGSRPALRFDGFQSPSSGDYLHGTNDVGIPDAFTSFAVASWNGFNSANVPALIGVPGTMGAARAYSIISGQLYFATWANDSNTLFSVSPNTYRIWTERLSTNMTFAEMFDTTANTSTNFHWNMSGIASPGAGYYVGGLASFTRNFGGDVAELIYYRGSLGETDRLAVETYLKQKYYQISAFPASLSYQWNFNGVPIAGATNSTLSISSAQGTNAGSYNVVVCNGSACVTSSNATLTINFPPTITSQPVSQTVIVSTPVSFSADGTGTAPLSYQWTHNGQNVSGATTSSLSIASVQTADAGSYALVLNSPYGSATSSSAALSVTTSTLQAANVTAQGSSSVTEPVSLIALGNENAVGFSLTFDPTYLSLAGVALGSNATAAGATLFYNTNQQSSGHLGIVVSLPTGSTFAAGTQEVALVTFDVGLVANGTVTPIGFGDLPTAREISDISANPLPGTYIAGSATLTPTAFEGDVSPRPNGNQSVTISDWVQVGRFVAGLDVPADGAEFQRADCAPRNTLGNGELTVSDWVQAGRYAVGLDPLTPIGGPTTFSPPPSFRAPKTPVTRTVSLQTDAKNGVTNVVSVELNAQGNENAVGFSLSFDQTVVKFVGASVGSGAPGATMNVNSTKASNGIVGIAIAMPFGQSFAAGTQECVRLSFVPTLYSSSASNLTFTDTPIVREVSDVTANALPASYVNNSMVVDGLVPSLTISQDGSGNVTLTWPAAATGYGLESVSDLNGTWSVVNAGVSTVGTNSVLTQPASTNQLYFRLHKP